MRKHAGLWKLLTGETTKVDAVTAPTALYDPSTTYESGEDPDLPAVTMTPYAARQYTKWLSAITGRDYRLPSEAEWEHAARGGGGGPYGSGAGGAAVAADSLGRHAWTADNSDFAAQTAGGLAPNAWGLHDMLGNAAEWVLDGPRDSGPAPPAAGPVAWADAVAWPTKAYPRIAKGGHWDAAPADCRVASRTLSEDADWKASDPNYPKSPWWYSDYPATAVGFRVVRPLREMDEAMRRRVWEVDHPDIQADVDARLEEGRGKQDRADQDLPAAIKALSSPGIDGLLN
ncbi:MAG: SUMF1/EgtB/PvdO family nonheme iron enzyme [Planctomycetota bacterium]